MSQITDRFVTAFKLHDGTHLNGSNERLRELRRSAIESFGKLGLPGRKSEAWKYTPISRYVRDDFAIDLAGRGAADSDVVDVNSLRIPGMDGPLLVLVDGVFSSELSRTDGLPEGVVAGSLRSALAEQPEIAESYLASYNDIESQPFEALNTAFIQDGAFISVADRTDVAEPLEILMLTSAEAPRFLQPRILIQAGENAGVQVVEHQRSLGNAACFNNSLCEIYAARHARVSHIRLQDEGPNAYHVSTTRIRQDGESDVSTFTATLGGRLIRNNLSFLPDGEHCTSHLNGVFVGTGDRHIDNHTFVDHAWPNCESNELYKGILDDKSIGVFNGKVFVRRDAQKTNAYQSNNSVVLSESAKMFAKPELEIYADDVKCSHGATTGQLDEEAVFYLRSRGIDAKSARTMMLNAFAGEALDLISVVPVREHVEALLERELVKL